MFLSKWEVYTCQLSVFEAFTATVRSCMYVVACNYSTLHTTEII